jgi:hypothetical protein
MTAEQLSAVPVVILGNKIDIQVTSRVFCIMSIVIPAVCTRSLRAPHRNQFFCSRAACLISFNINPNIPFRPFVLCPPPDPSSCRLPRKSLSLEALWGCSQPRARCCPEFSTSLQASAAHASRSTFSRARRRPVNVQSSVLCAASPRRAVRRLHPINVRCFSVF